MPTLNSNDAPGAAGGLGLRCRVPLLGWGWRYGFAVVAAAAGFGLRVALTMWVGPGLPTYITFYPAIMAVALLAGFGPGLLATVVAGGLVTCWVLPPVGQFAIASPVDRLGLVVFTGMGLFMSVVAEFYRRNQRKAAAYDRDVALRASEERYRRLFQSLQEGFYLAKAIFDEHGVCCDAVYLDVNPAFERIMGRPREQLIGKRMKTLVPGLKPEWLEVFGTVTRTGEGINHQSYSEVYGKYFEAFVFRAIPGQFGVLVADITERQHAADALRESQTRLRLVLQANAIGTFEVDLRTGEGQWNTVEFELLGLTPGDVPDTPETFFRYVHPDDLEAVKGKWEEAMRGGNLDTEFRIVRADGQERWLAGKGRFIYDGEARESALRFMGVNFDITGQKRKQEQLQRLNRALNALSHSGQLLMRATSEADLLGEACKIVVQDCGYAMVWFGFAEADEAKSVRPAAFAGFEEGYLDTLKISWADTERGRGPTGTAIRTGQPCRCPNMLADPRFRPWRAEALKRGYASSSALPLMAAGRAFGALTLYAREANGFQEAEVKLLTELAADFAHGVMSLRTRAAKEQAELALKASEVRFRKIFDHVATGLALTDCAGRFMQCNAAYCDLLGYSQEELAEMAFSSLIHPEDREHNMGFIRQLLDGKIPSFEIENRYVRKDGRLLWVHKYVSLLYDDRGRPAHIVALVTDITEREQTEALFRFLGKCGTRGSGEGFFPELARYLAQAMDMNFVCIDRLEEGRLAAQTLAVFHNGHFEDNVSYALKDTPCGDVVGKRICCFPRNVRARFPKDAVLQDLQAESYLGTTLWSAQGTPIGLIAVIGRQPMKDTRLAESILHVVAVRAAGELERQQAETELRTSRNDLSRAQAVAHIGSWRLNVLRNELLWSEENWRIFGVPPGTPLTYETFLATLHPDDRTYVHEKWSASLRGEPYDIEHRICVGDTVKWVRERAELEFDAAGTLQGGFGTTQDITERKQAEVVSTRYELIAQYARDPLLLVGLDGTIIEANLAAEQLYGYSRNELLKLKLHALRQDDPEGVDLQIQYARVKGILFESVHTRKDGSRVPVEVNSRGVVIAGKEMLLSVIRDIRQRKEAELTLRRAKEDAERASQAKSEFLAVMSHELRTPLNAIMGFSQVLEKAYFGPLTAKQKEYITDIYESGRHLLSLINDILELSKIEAGKMEPQWSRVNMERLLEQSLVLIQETCRQQEIQLSLDLDPPVRGLHLRADERRLKQILYNLLSNAAKFTPAGGAIRVRARLLEAAEPTLEVSVADTGIGIAPNDQERVFEAFYQVHQELADKTPGTGLGLSLTKQLVAMHGGRLWLTSAGEGQGSQFTFVIPAIAPAPESPQP